MPGQYAQDTQVTVEKSKAEIEKILRQYGASSFVSGWQDDIAVVMFTMQSKNIRFVLHMPDRDLKQYTHTPAGKLRDTALAEAEWEKGCRAAWRSLKLVIQAKLEAVAAGIVTFIEEFSPHIVLPNGQRVGDLMVPAIETAYRENSSQPALSAMLGMGTRELTSGKDQA